MFSSRLFAICAFFATACAVPASDLPPPPVPEEVRNLFPLLPSSAIGHLWKLFLIGNGPITLSTEKTKEADTDYPVMETPEDSESEETTTQPTVKQLDDEVESTVSTNSSDEEDVTEKNNSTDGNEVDT